MKFIYQVQFGLADFSKTPIKILYWCLFSDSFSEPSLFICSYFLHLPLDSSSFYCLLCINQFLKNVNKNRWVFLGFFVDFLVFLVFFFKVWIPYLLVAWVSNATIK